MYNWRKMDKEQRKHVLKIRQLNHFPMHSLPHKVRDKDYFHISAACYEHKHIIGATPNRISKFENLLLKELIKSESVIVSYVILPNHYHILIKPEDINLVLKIIFKVHQITGFYWNKEDAEKGRKVWCNALETGIKGESHFWATINYIHNNPIKHGYVQKWQEWPFSSAVNFIENEGYEKTKFI